MHRKTLVLAPLALVIAAAAGTAVYLLGKQPVRDGQLSLNQLSAPVSVRYDERGVPHLQAQNQLDLYRALGYVHAQDRLFQMEMLRRLARGELAEVLGEKLVETDRLFRTLRIRDRASDMIARQDRQSPAWLALQAYLDGVNQYQESRPAPLEFDLLGIPKRAFTAEDSASIAGYLAYSFAAGLRTEPTLTYVRDQLGAEYLQAFDLDWHPEGVATAPALAASDWRELNRIARISQQAMQAAGLPQYEGSNAWVIAGSHTGSGKPLLAGDPHISFATPSVWYEAQLSAPGFELYGHHQALNPFAMLGHNQQMGWSLTMFQNDDLDLIAEKLNPDNPQQVWYQGRWVDLTTTQAEIRVKDGETVKLTLHSSPHGPIINDALGAGIASSQTPVAMWWGFLETPNPILNGFYDLNHATDAASAALAAEQIQAPGLNILWASAAGDIAWWAAAALPIRPAGVNPAFILNGSTAQADKLGFYPFRDNPQELNPGRGYIISANHQPVPASGIQVPGYYNLPDRAQRLHQRLADPAIRWDLQNSQAVQLDNASGYPQRLLQPLLDDLQAAAADQQERALVDQLAGWNGDHALDSVPATLFNQLVYELARNAMGDELGEAFFDNLLGTRALDLALPRLAAAANSPWWDQRNTPEVESRADTVKQAWQASLQHLRKTYGDDSSQWQWGKAHTLTHNHPLARQEPLDQLFNVGPFSVPGGREMPNNLSSRIGSAPWKVAYGPSTRRLVDFADPEHSLGINPVGQSGVLFDRHYQDQAEAYVQGEYVPQHFSAEDVTANTRSTLILTP
ncbi:penicillin acylase family protein [Pseudomonas sp. N040]|uniref:penicillin acylase family protein n=1 Tax=Pseudomonas sp. N040 TaxID=2785325 RepID=UPI0018A2F9C6|nr:penicillin acylase family protein [Pseudomonas sp. N040]MBF7730031.1 penicillin acylase family protein [Pseudomonas sp. N040]MBW7013673.1 penicillin acylase family protein [Pseudomonas sp. N040]